MHAKSAVVITLLMVSSFAGACGPEFFAPCKVDRYGDSDVQPAQSFNKRNGETDVDDQSVKQFLLAVKTMNRSELLGLLNETGTQLLNSVKSRIRIVE